MFAPNRHGQRHQKKHCCHQAIEDICLQPTLNQMKDDMHESSQSVLSDERGLLQVLEVPSAAYQGQRQPFFPPQQQHKQAQNWPTVQCDSLQLSQGQDEDEDLISPGCSVAIIMPDGGGLGQTAASTLQCSPHAKEGAAERTTITEAATACRSQGKEGSMQALMQAASSTTAAPAALARGFGSFFLVTPPEAAQLSPCTRQDPGPDNEGGQSASQAVSQQTCSLEQALDDSMVEDCAAATNPVQRLRQQQQCHHEEQLWDQQLQGCYRSEPSTASLTEPANSCQGRSPGDMDTVTGDLLDTVLDRLHAQSFSGPAAGEAPSTTTQPPDRPGSITTTGLREVAWQTPAAEKVVGSSAVTAADAEPQEVDKHRQQSWPYSAVVVQELPEASAASESCSLNVACLPYPGQLQIASHVHQTDDPVAAAVVEGVPVHGVASCQEGQKPVAAAAVGCSSSNPSGYLLSRAPLDFRRELLGDVSGNINFADVFSDDNMDPEEPGAAADRCMTGEGTAPKLQVDETQVSARSGMPPQHSQQQKYTKHPQPVTAAVLPMHSFFGQRTGPVVMLQSWLPPPPLQQQQYSAASIKLGLPPKAHAIRTTITTAAVVGQNLPVQPSSCGSHLNTVSWNSQQQQQQQQHAENALNVPQALPGRAGKPLRSARSCGGAMLSQTTHEDNMLQGMLPQTSATAPSPAFAHPTIQATSHGVPRPAPGAVFAAAMHTGTSEQHALDHPGWQSFHPHSRHTQSLGQQQPVAGQQAPQGKAGYDQLQGQRDQHALHQPVHRPQHHVADWASPSARGLVKSAHHQCVGVVPESMQHFQLHQQQPQASLPATQQQQQQEQHQGAVAGLDNTQMCRSSCAGHALTFTMGLERAPHVRMQPSSLQGDAAYGFSEHLAQTANLQQAGRTVTSQQLTQSGMLASFSASDTAAAAATSTATPAQLHKLPAKTGTGRPRGRPRKHPLPTPAADDAARAAQSSALPLVGTWQQQQQQCLQARLNQQHSYQHYHTQQQSVSLLCTPTNAGSATGPPQDPSGGLAMNRKRGSSFSGPDEVHSGSKLPRPSVEPSPAAHPVLSMRDGSHSNRPPELMFKLQKKPKGTPKPVTQDGAVIPPPAGPEMAARGWPPFSDLVVGGFFPPGTYDFSCGTVSSVVATVTPTGLIQWNNETFQSISSFALAVVRSVKTTRQACDGWRECRLKGIKIHEWRAAFLEKRAPPPVPPEAIIQR